MIFILIEKILFLGILLAEKTLIFGVSYAVDSLIMALLKKKIDLNVEEDYYVNISPPPIPDSTDFGDSVISGIFVDVTEELVKATLGWLREREKEQTEKPKLKICINGNLLNIDVQDMEIMMKVLKECSKKKEDNKVTKTTNDSFSLDTKPTIKKLFKMD